MRSSSVQRAIALALLAALGNSLGVRLFFHVDFVFGTIATLLLGWLYGPWIGLALGTICSLPTIWLWGHPYAALIFGVEAAFVGARARANGENLIAADALYWAVLGLPLVYLFYGQVLGMDGVSTGVIMAKQMTNGLANSVCAMWLLLLWRARAAENHDSAPSIYQWLFCGITGLLFFPALILIVLASRGELESVERMVANRLRAALRPVAEHLAYWLSRHRHAVLMLASAGETSHGNADYLTAEIKRIQILFPDFNHLYVADSNGVPVAFVPRPRTPDEGVIAQTISTQALFRTIRGSTTPVVSQLFDLTHSELYAPQIIAVPIASEQFGGYAAGTLNPQHIIDSFSRLKEAGIEITVTDLQGTVVVSTSPSTRPLQPLPERFRSSRALAENDLKLVGPEGASAHMLRWKMSSYIMELQPGTDLPWRLIAELPVAPFQRALYSAYIRNFSAALGLFLLCIGLARFVARRLSDPLKALANSTANLTAHDQPADEPPRSTGIAELDQFAANFAAARDRIRTVLSALHQRSDELNEINRQLDIENRTRRDAEQKLRQREQLLEEQNAVLLTLIQRTPADSSFETITEACARVLNVARASIWLYNGNGNQIVCQDLFERASGTHTSGLSLMACDFPAYFEALRQMRTVAAHDAENDPRTREFKDAYLRPLGISSMLDAPVWLEGKLAGVVCHEHVGSPRKWTAEEETFAGSMADLVSMRLQEAQRKSAEQERDRLFRQVQEYSAELEKRVKERTARFEELYLEMEAFCYTISHDLRAPLRAIHSFCQLLQADYGHQLDPTATDLFQRITRAAAQMDRLIQDLLEYSRVTRSELDMAPVRLSEVLNELCQSNHDLSTDRAEIIIDTGRVQVLANRSLLRQCFANLLSNALKFVEPGVKPRVRIWAESTGERVKIFVQDNGIGIPNPIQERIFKLFERGHTTQKYEGTGIGLAIVKRAVGRMGGSISVRSSEGQGSIFCIELAANPLRS